MPITVPFTIVDVFSQGKYTGNQLAVFKNAGNLTTDEMQRVAKEINFSESAFIVSNHRENDRYQVRIFTPNEEIPFAGHPLIGTAYVIRQDLLDRSSSKIHLHVKAGMIPIALDHRSEVFWMQQNEPTFGQTFSNVQLSKLLGIPEQYMDTRYPIQEVETGLPVIIVPLLSLHAVKKVTIQKEHYYRLIEQTNAKGILVFSPETYHEENDLNVRDFADYYGIPEDPATGSSNGCLAAYLVKYRYLGTDRIDVRVEQGYEIGRPSLLFLRAKQTTSIEVMVGGKVEKIAQGEWLL